MHLRPGLDAALAMLAAVLLLLGGKALARGEVLHFGLQVRHQPAERAQHGCVVLQLHLHIVCEKIRARLVMREVLKQCGRNRAAGMCPKSDLLASELLVCLRQLSGRPVQLRLQLVLELDVPLLSEEQHGAGKRKET
jgi:hypothetical protein